jgi:hypothetical protein
MFICIYDVSILGASLWLIFLYPFYISTFKRNFYFYYVSYMLIVEN